MIASVLLFLGGISGCAKTKELNFNQIEVSVRFAPVEDNNFSTMSVTYKNISEKSAFFTFPFPADAESLEESKMPLLGILLKHNNGAEENFLYTVINGEPKHKKTRVMLSTGEATTVGYKLSTFWRWGPCGPDLGGHFSTYIRPGDCEVETSVWLLKSIGNQEEVLKSQPQKILCSFPEWFLNWCFLDQWDKSCCLKKCGKNCEFVKRDDGEWR